MKNIDYVIFESRNVSTLIKKIYNEIYICEIKYD